jgi:hypothetical protein
MTLSTIEFPRGQSFVDVSRILVGVCDLLLTKFQFWKRIFSSSCLCVLPPAGPRTNHSYTTSSLLNMSDYRIFWHRFDKMKFRIRFRCPYPIVLQRPAQWSSGQSSWQQIQSSGFESRPYQIFWEVAGLERGLFSLVSTAEELLGRKSSGSGLEIRKYGSRDPSRWPRGAVKSQNLALTWLTRGGRSVGIVARGLRPRSVSYIPEGLTAKQQSFTCLHSGLFLSLS